MATFDFRLPSKIPYGYIGFSGTLEEFQALDVEKLGQDYANKFLRYKAAEAAALAAGPSSPKSPKSPEDILSEGDVEDLIKRELGGVVVPDDAPWNDKGSMGGAEPHSKPWSDPAIAVGDMDPDWDFG